MTNVAFLIRAGISLLALTALASFARAKAVDVIPIQTPAAVHAPTIHLN